MIQRSGRLAWLLATFALNPIASDAGDTSGKSPKAQTQESTQTSKTVASKNTQASRADEKTATRSKVSPSKADTTDANAETHSDLEADDELLEFLGSVDLEESEWVDEVSRTDRTASSAQTREKSAKGVAKKSTRDP